MSVLLKSSKHFNLVCVYKFGICVIDLCLAPLLDLRTGTRSNFAHQFLSSYLILSSINTSSINTSNL